MNDQNIYLEKKDVYEYPLQNPLFHPSVNYPEYIFGETCVSSRTNEIYDMVRNVLHGLELDKKNFGTKQWNPLGDMITPGDTVVVKPNMVKHCDSIEQYECTLTHPSVVRTIVDYCIIAKAGKIILGDAPIQGADMKKICNDFYYNDILQFYHVQDQEVYFRDFRNLVVRAENGIIRTVKEGDLTDCIKIDLGEQSKHYQEKETTKYETCGYVDQKINENHHHGKHQYIISKDILEADVIINLPKPKTHRFAGLTGAQKNFVGASPDKESLPHFKAGVIREGGDETNHSGLLADFIAKVYRKYLWACKKEKITQAKFYYLLYYIAIKIKKKDLYTHGAWYGNDTIWRTIIDLNTIIFFADQNGQLDFTKPHRKVFTIGDMIIVGEKDGPLTPDAKKMGCILGSFNCAIFDYVFCEMTGFDVNKIPTVFHSVQEKRLCPENWEKCKLHSNIDEFNNVLLENLKFPNQYHLEPHPFWKEFL